MGKINVLGFDVANLIAAGEVVDRPSSVVKELLENAIDSGADKIVIEIKRGGTTFIRIADNGCGIEHEDLPVSILRHATSKIKNATDLESIMTLGFRGEALAAISSVSKLRIMSRQRDKALGSFLEAHAGNIINHMESGCAEGTTVIVEDLFYNVPARKKFLKKDATEAASISAIVEKVAMSRSDISFRYIVDGEVKYVTAGDGKLEDVIYAILGRDVAKKSIKVEREDNGIKVSGFISTPELVRANRNMENFYINSRFVKSKTAMAALEQAFVSYIPSDKFPFCILNIEIDPSTVDVNVHPAKLEVKFSNEKLVFDAVYYAVRTALTSEIERPSLYKEPEEKLSQRAQGLVNTPFPVTDRSAEAPKPQRIVFDTNTNVGTLRQDNTIDYSSLIKKEEEKKVEPSVSLPVDTYATEDAFSLKFPTAKAQPTLPKAEPIELTPTIEKKDEIVEPVSKKAIVPDYKIIGEAFNSYVIVELGDIMYLIDKHAAHERIIFEDLKAKLNMEQRTSQMLLLPLDVIVSGEELSALNEWQEEIKKTGFGYEIRGNKVLIDEIPAEIEISAATDAFLTLASKLASGEAEADRSRYERFEKALYQTSCKAAIKAGRIYDSEHIKWICDRVLTLDNIKYCPHGRPIAFEITKHFLEKQFERIK
ncbi:MAG: DNA mismatch repair endonuclease MutL [Clostridia bacterium]|nr:DNA mismatch repair endonuclease MutL [Clostridia bacterium]MBQ7907820.1 DNA mismatch repair endonuclease MutL [Clostridia bacterium]